MPKPKKWELRNPKLAAAMTSVMKVLALTDAPIVDGKVEFDEQATAKLKETLSEKTMNDLIEAFNKDLKETAQVDDIKASVETILKDLEIPQPELEQIIEAAKTENGSDPLALIQAVETSLTSWQKKNKEKLDALGNKPEPDTPVDALIKNKLNEAMKHSATHVFGSGKDYDLIADRPWNKALVDGLETSGTDFSDQTIVEKLNGDIKHYYRENPTMIKSLHRDNFELPSFWPKRLKVDDQVADGAIVTGEITQGRKFDFLPKNVQEIDAEIGYIFPIQIDAKWSGFDLQKIEASWLNFMNQEGSSPEKMRFVRFLIEELMKRARLEDRIATIRGLFVQTPKGATVGGRFINRQNGLFYLLWKHRDLEQKFRPFTTIAITAENVYDFFHHNDGSGLGFLYRLPEEVRNTPNLVMYLHTDVWTWYKAKYKQINGTNMDYKGKPEHFEDFSNIRVETLVDHTNKQFVFTTFDDNIEILENIPSEKSAYKLQVLLRDIFLMGDYKLGIRIVYVGKKWDASKPEAFKVQSVWSNDAPIFSDDTFIPVYDDTSGIITPTYKNIQVHESFKTDITQFEGLKAGQIIRIKGNTLLGAAQAVKHNSSKIVLAGNQDFPLKSGGILTLRVLADLKLQEVKRTTSVPAAPSENYEFETDTIDASLATTYVYKGAAAATLAEIENGFDGKTITIYGKTGAALTVEDVAGNISVGTDVVLNADDKYLELVKVDGVWYKGNTNA
jgi:vacuolar-type H+-ATPase subunit E/Vma4